MSKPRSASAREKTPPAADSISVVRTGLAALLVVGGIAWVGYYVFAVYDDLKPTWMADLGDWNFLIGFGALFLGLIIAANRRTPLGRGRGVVVGMLGSFLLGLAWIIVYYVTSQDASIPVFRELGNYNLLVGIGFMTVGFVYATRWE
ncbi:MAG: Cell division protein CrgA [uncultured Nocardioidaceae bacterium]|uniref:Cell division protein CrgA n=1 Tax=uncultured Nocardioidaceae bacterium TaxID=253824 RepID=A0A6J4MP18_9ACTN|nr:MAG: Cell division protein CrgA [uncultured Nocardioidaceae bacterium]